LKWQGNAFLNWDYRQWTLGWNTHYYDSYWVLSSHAVVPNLGSAKIPSQTYHDLLARYRFTQLSSGVGSVLSDLEVQVGIRNALNKRPPIDTSAQFYSTYGDPRLRSYYITVGKSF
jgi:outer membrane receptor protein involved in Fe transport